MKFYLVKEKEVEFSVAPTTELKHYIRNVKLQAALQFGGGNGEDWLSERDFKMLRILVEDALEPLDWNVCVAVGIIRSNKNNRNFIRVTGEEKGNILERIKHVLSSRGLMVNLKVEVKPVTTFLLSNQTKYMIDTMETNEVDISEISSKNKECQGARLLTSACFNPCYWENPCYQNKGVLSIICNVFQKQDSIFTLASQSQTSITRKILEEKVSSDVTIITKDGYFIKCHKCFLSVHSPVLEEKFKSLSKDSETCTLKTEMSEASVKAFLAYLYYSELEKATKNCATALEIFQASLDYNIAALQGFMRTTLLTKPDNWYNVEVALKLFLFARNLDDGAELKMRAVKLLKFMNKRLQNSKSYDQLFKENPVAAKELCQHAFSLVNLNYVML